VSELLYHYTTASGFHGIIKSGELHATDTRYMNDESEQSYARGLLLELKGKDNLRRYPNWANPYDTIRPTPVYAVSFCADGDLLSQWRGYGDENGLSIGFEPAPLLDHVPTPAVPWHGFAEWFRIEVTYSRRRQLAAIRKALNLWHKRILEPDAAVGHALGIAHDALTKALLTCKDEAFKEENETRLVQLDEEWRQATRYRVSDRYGLVPYSPLKAGFASSVKTKKAIFDIREIVVGPTQYPDLAVDAVRGFLASSGYGVAQIQVHKSRIPLRPA
jgi:hypothetical protein